MSASEMTVAFYLNFGYSSFTWNTENRFLCNFGTL